MTSLIIDFALLSLLMVSIARIYVVGRKLKTLQSTLEELYPAIEAFTKAVEKSETSVSQMARHAQQLKDEKIQHNVGDQKREEFMKRLSTNPDELITSVGTNHKSRMIKAAFRSQGAR